VFAQFRTTESDVDGEGGAMNRKNIIRWIAAVVLAGGLGAAVLLAAAIFDESFGWNDALGFSLLLAGLGVLFVTTRYAHRHQSL
jgi:hypothetical protein